MRNFFLILILVAAGAGTFYYFKEPEQFSRLAGGLIPRPAATASAPATSETAPAPVAAPAPIPEPPKWAPPAVLPAEPNWTWTTPDKAYENVVVTKIEADRVTIRHSGGMAVIQTWMLPDDIRQRLNYDPAAAAAAPALRQEPQPGSDTAAAPADSTPAAADGPPSVYKDALTQARLTGKPILLHFDGSTYCPPCQWFDKEVASTPAFQNYLKANFVALTLDYTKDPPTTDPVKVAVSEKYHIDGFPTFLVIDGHEKELGRFSGYGTGLGERWVEDQLNAIVNKPTSGGSLGGSVDVAPQSSTLDAPVNTAPKIAPLDSPTSPAIEPTPSKTSL
jgi:thiol-disulfide isomerase/thioredoxin